ncbi:hypothetical protein CCR75_004311 [Bremia lactucae]|uniref:Uncharacterized protein n=1 Tax=Bremia lactucae TaxID=4779 RepID=A0A976FLY5_BRELC|nr:hypothetical protein CCR75_004311 [Bremia lactucae]
MGSLAKLLKAQSLALEKLKVFVGNEQMHDILSQGLEVLNVRLYAFMHIMSTFIGRSMTI